MSETHKFEVSYPNDFEYTQKVARSFVGLVVKRAKNYGIELQVSFSEVDGNKIKIVFTFESTVKGQFLNLVLGARAEMKQELNYIKHEK